MATKKIVKEQSTQAECCHPHKSSSQNSSNCAVYGFGVIGALVYFYPQMIGFSGLLTGIGKSLFWPALLVFQALNLLGLWSQ